MQFKKLFNIYDNMQKNGVVIYGAGKEGKLAIEVLQKENINIWAVADKKVGLVDKFECISLDELMDYSKNIVCIVSPLRNVDKEKQQLKEHFDMVIDNYIVHMIRYCIMPSSYMTCFPFNHYESPYLSENELSKYTENNIEPYGVNLNKEFQHEMMLEIANMYMELKEDSQNPSNRYTINNSYYNWEDAVVLSTFMNIFQPKRIIEIGSGFSTFRMLDTNEKWCNKEVEINCIEPYPDRLLNGLREKDALNINKKFVQDIPLIFFEDLQQNDILFIDSSHVAKQGGDILYEYFQIFPILNSGVLIHIHDIFFPFVYPKDWLGEGRCYNEAFILQALLTNNEQYEILYFNNMMHNELTARINDKFDSGSSIWLRKK